MKYFMLIIILCLVSCASKDSNIKARNGAGGHVKLKFDVDTLGNPINIKIVESSDKVFNKLALKSVKRWKYKPKIINGVAVIQHNMTYKMEFRLDNKDEP